MKRTLSAAVPLTLALAVVALADVDVTIENADKIQGTAVSGESVDTFRIWCPAGAQLSAKLKLKKWDDPYFTLMYPPEDPAPAKARNLSSVDPLERSGMYVVQVGTGAGGMGDYTLSVAFKLPKKTTRTLTLGAEESVVELGAVAGTVLKVKAKAAKGSSAVPRILRVEGPEGFLLDVAGAGKSASDALGSTELTRDGDYRVVLDDGGSEGGGDADVTVQLKQPKPAKRRLDLSARAIGSTSGERLAVSEVVGAEGGVVSVALPGDGGPDSVISGSSVTIPSGALPVATPIVVATASDVKPKGKDGGAGPSVFFGPDGLSFEKDVSVTIPFDIAQFEGDLSTLRIYTRDARGKVTLVDPPYDVDEQAGTCTFPSSHFSSFRAARAGAGGASGAFVGVWKQIIPEDPTELVFLIIKENGRIEIVGGSTLDSFCLKTVVFTQGAPLDLIYEIVDGNLRLREQTDPIVEYEPASPNDVPTDCVEQQF